MTTKIGRPVLFDYDRMIVFLEKQLEKSTSNLKLVGFAAALEMVKECAPTWIADNGARAYLASRRKETEENENTDQTK